MKAHYREHRLKHRFFLGRRPGILRIRSPQKAQIDTDFLAGHIVHCSLFFTPCYSLLLEVLYSWIILPPQSEIQRDQHCQSKSDGCAGVNELCIDIPAAKLIRVIFDE